MLDSGWRGQALSRRRGGVSRRLKTLSAVSLLALLSLAPLPAGSDEEPSAPSLIAEILSDANPTADLGWLDKARSETPTTESLQLTLDALEPRILNAENILKQAEPSNNSASPEGAPSLGRIARENWRLRLEALRELESLLRQAQTALEQNASLRESLVRVAEEKSQPRASGFEEQPPYSYDLLLQLEERETRLRRELETLELANAQTAFGQEKTNARLEKAEAERRAAREELQLNQETKRETELAREVAKTEIERAAARWALTLNRLTANTAELEQEIRRERLAILNADIVYVSERSHLPAAELREKKESLRRQREELERRIDRLREENDSATRRLNKARESLEVSADEDAINNWQLYIAYLETWTNLARQRLAAMEERAERLDNEARYWGRLRAIAGGVDRREWGAWREEALAFIEALDRERKVAEARQDDLLAQTSDLRERALDIQSPNAGGRWLDEQAASMEHHAEFLREQLEISERFKALARLVSEEIGRRLDSLGWEERWDIAREWVGSVWESEIYNIGEHPVTVRKLVIGFIALGAGLWVARRFATFAGQRALPRLGVSESASATVAKDSVLQRHRGGVFDDPPARQYPAHRFCFPGWRGGHRGGFWRSEYPKQLHQRPDSHRGSPHSRGGCDRGGRGDRGCRGNWLAQCSLTDVFRHQRLFSQ